MAKINFKRPLFLNVWRLARAYWVSEEKWQAIGLLVLVIGLNLGIVYIHVLLNSWQGNFYNVLQEYNQEGFIKSIKDFTVLAGTYIAVAGYQIYVQMMLQIRWRRWMTEKYLRDWLENQTYYRMRLFSDYNSDNPDQRISEDVNLFVSLTLSLSLGLLREVVTLGSFILILWNLSGVLNIPLGGYQFSLPGYLVWAAIAYSAAGTWLTVKLGRPLIGLNFNQQRYEADFRFSLMRLRENSEGIALYRGETHEQANFMERFQRVVANYWNIMKLNKRLVWFTSGYSQASIIFSILVASPRYFAKLIQLGEMFRINNAYGKVQDALSFFVDSYTRLAEWRAVVNRLNDFSANMLRAQLLRETAKELIISYAPQDNFAVKDLSVYRPDGQALINHLQIELDPRDWLLVMGPSGCGKSTLMRSLAGIWPFCKGNICLPEGQNVMFLPQKSYMPLNALREVLLYPGLPHRVSDDQIKDMLAACELPLLINQLDSLEDWAQTLSLGEQQRVAFVRVLLHRPAWLFLDEATSALDEPTEKRMYELIRERLPQTGIISVGHRRTLTGYHKNRLELDGRGNWSILPAVTES